jgi:preprotein translocase subunit SecG
MWVALVIVHVLVGLALILIVLLQTGKGAEMGAAFGGSSQTVFGSAGPGSFLGKLTTFAAIIFMVTSMSLAYLSSGHRSSSVMSGAGRQVERPSVPVGPSPGKSGPLMNLPAQPQAQPAPGAPAHAAPNPAPGPQK